MKLALNLARNQDGFTGNNPPVGCIIVKNNQIVSYGVTSYNGRPHAETIALNKNKKKILDLLFIYHWNPVRIMAKHRHAQKL